MELISVIIPVYRVERYLCECVDSVLSSTYSKLEIILVDDGSPDSCPSICDAYAVKDDRVKVIHQSNSGLCAARNAGLNVAKGTYIAFVDSDDVVSPFLYERMIDAIETNNADWAACEFTRTYKTLPLEIAPETRNIRVLEGMEQQLAVLVSAPPIRSVTWTSGYVWNKLYRKDLITEQFLPGCFNAEDLQFNWEYIHNSTTLAIVPYALYYYRVNEESITETYRKANTDKVAERGMSLSQVFESIANQNPPECYLLTPYLISRTVNVMHGSLFRMHAISIAKQHPAFCAHARKYICRNWTTVWQEKETYNIRAKIPVTMYVFVYPLWLLLTKLIKL